MGFKSLFSDRILLVIVLVAALVRLSLAIYVAPYPERYVQSDGAEYDRIALNLLSGHGYSKSIAPPYVQDNFRVPGYPVLLAAVYGIFGHRPDLVLYLQAVAGGLTSMVVYALARWQASRRVALLAASFIAVSPHSITYSALLWSDTVYTLLLSIGILLAIVMFSRNELRWVILSSLVIGIATIFHARTLMLPVLILIVLFSIRMKTLSLKEAFAQAVVYLGVFVVVLFPWMARNYVVFGIPNLTSAAGMNTLYYGAALIEARKTGESQWSIAEKYQEELTADTNGRLNEAEFATLAFRRGLQLISEDPISYSAVHLAGAAKVFLPGTLSIERLISGNTVYDPAAIYGLFASTSIVREEVLAIISRIAPVTWVFIAVDAFMVLAMSILWISALLLRESGTRWVWILSLVVLYLALVPGPAGAPRFRVALMPELAVLSAYGAILLLERLRKTGDLPVTLKPHTVIGRMQS